MRDWWKIWLGALVLAWKKQLCLPLPEKLNNLYQKSGKPYEMAAFVLLGGLGAVAAILTGSLAGIVFNRFGGALVFGIVSWVLWLFHDNGRGDGMISSVLASCLPGRELPYSLVLTVFMMILKVALLMMLFYSGKAWMLIFVWGGVSGIEALLLREAGFAPPVMDFSSSAVKRFWVVSVFVLLVSFLIFPLGSAFATLSFAAVWKISGKGLPSACNPVDFIRCSGASAGWLILLSAVLMV